MASAPLSPIEPGGVPTQGESGIPLALLAVVIGSVLLFAGVFPLGRGSEGRGSP